MANDKDPVFCAADIIKRAKLAKEFKTDSELAAFLGISRSTLSNWNARNSIDFPLLLGSLDDVAHRALFRSSPLASYVTGANIPVDGGAALRGGRDMRASYVPRAEA